MFDIGGWEFLLIAILGIIIIGPKELPGAIRTVSGLVRRARELAREFQSGLEEVARESELDKVSDAVRTAADPAGRIREEIEGTIDPDGEVRDSMDFDREWTDDIVDYDDPEFTDDHRIGQPDPAAPEPEPEKTDKDPEKPA